MKVKLTYFRCGLDFKIAGAQQIWHFRAHLPAPERRGNECAELIEQIEGGRSLCHQNQTQAASRFDDASHLIHRLQHVPLIEQFEKVTADKRIEGAVPEWKLARIGARTMGIRADMSRPDLRLRLG